MSDASAVAHEIMRRVKKNLETLIPRLAQIGYQFGYGWVQPGFKEPFDWQKREAYKRLIETSEILGTAPDIEAKRRYEADRLTQLIELGAPRILIEHAQNAAAHLNETPQQVVKIAEFEAMLGTPLTMVSNSVWEIAGS